MGWKGCGRRQAGGVVALTPVKAGCHAGQCGAARARPSVDAQKSDALAASDQENGKGHDDEPCPFVLAGKLPGGCKVHRW